jgi:hypothetical protein
LDNCRLQGLMLLDLSPTPWRNANILGLFMVLLS